MNRATTNSTKGTMTARTCSHEGCKRIVPPRKRKCMRHLSTKGFKKTTMRDSTKGMHSWQYRGYKKTRKRPKRQGNRMGNVPYLRTSTINPFPTK
jgi:hypothetical protein